MVKEAAVRRHAEKFDVFAVDVGKRIREARKAQGLTLAQLGGEDLSRSFLSLVESGRSRISLRALSIVAERLDLPIGHFLADADRSAEMLAELLLDEAQSKLEQQQPDECLRILDRAAGLDVDPTAAAWLKGRALAAAGRPREAVPILSDTLAAVGRDADQQIVAQIRYDLGAALYSAGNYDEALAVLRQSLDQATDGPEDRVLLGKITVCLGHILFVRGDTGGAISQYERARDLFGSIKDLRTQGCLYSGLSLAYKERGDLKAALRYSKLGAATYQASHNALQMAAELNNVAWHYLQLGELDQALATARDAVGRATALRAPDLEAVAHSTLAKVHLDRGDTDAAAHEAEAAEALAPNDAALSRVGGWKTLAEVADRQGNGERADALYRRALDSLRTTGQVAIFADTARAYSRLLQQRGDTERALEIALEALDVQKAG